jgi:hypothetical protein
MIEKGCFYIVILHTLVPKVVISSVSLLFRDYIESFIRIVNKVQRLLQGQGVRICARENGFEGRPLEIFKIHGI